jgi:hypothetical protein
MVTFLLKVLLRKALTIPLVWAVIYPNYDGDLIMRKVRLVDYDGTVEKTVAEVGKADIDLKWGSLFKDVVEVDQATLYDLRAEVAVDRPADIIRCMQGGSCFTKAGYRSAKKKKTGQEGLSDTDRGQDKSERKVLRVGIKSLSVERGQVKIIRDKAGVKVDVVRSEGENIQLPLNGSDLSLTADVFLSSADEKGGAAEKFPARLKLRWDGSSEVLTIRAKIKELPISLLQTAFPDLFPAVEAGFASGSPVQAQVEYGGRISGELALEYDHRRGEGKKWRVL